MKRLSAFFAVLLLFGAPCARAQPLWVRPYEPYQFSVEMLKPSIDTPPGEELSFFSSAWFVSGTALTSERMAITVEVPVAHYQSSVNDSETNAPPPEASEARLFSSSPPTPRSGTRSKTVLGNPYIGMSLTSAETPILLEVGLRLPLASDSSAATRLGTLTDVDRREAFAPNTFSTQAFLNYRLGLTQRLSLRLRGGSLFALNTSSSDAELLAQYSLQGWYEGNRLILGTGVTGRGLLTEEGSIAERTVHHFSATLIANLPHFQPGVLVRTPLDSAISDTVDLVVGLTLSVSP